MSSFKQRAAAMLFGATLALLLLSLGIPGKGTLHKSSNNETTNSPVKPQLVDNRESADESKQSHQGHSHSHDHHDHSHHSHTSSDKVSNEASDSHSSREAPPSLVRTASYVVDPVIFKGKSFNFSPFPGVSLSVKPSKVSKARKNSKTVIGKLYDDAGREVGSATITSVERDGEVGYAGFFRTESGTIYEIGHDENGEVVVKELEASKLPGCATEEDGKHNVRLALGKGHAADEMSFDNSAPVADESAPRGELAGDAGSSLQDVRVMLLWSNQAQSDAGGAAAIEAKTIAAVEDSNYAYEVSEIGIRITIAHIGPLGASETGNFNNDLYYMTRADGNWDWVRDWRDQYAADLVAMLNSNNQYCGLGWLGSPDPASEYYGYSVTNQFCLSNLTLPHELGHNMGSHHNPENAGGGGGAYNYSYGHHLNNQSYRTIMAYAPGARTYHFSNPNVSFRGFPTGTSGRDNARSHNNMAPFVAAFRGESFLLSGRVTDNGFPVEGATINGGSLGSQTTDADGYYEFYVGEGTSYVISASGSGSVFQPSPARGLMEDDVEINFDKIQFNRNDVNACLDNGPN